MNINLPSKTFAIRLAVTMAACIGASLPCSAANLLTNGSFESTPTYGNTNLLAISGQGYANMTAIPGWSFTNSTSQFSWILNSNFTPQGGPGPQEGSYYLNFSNFPSASTLSQSFSVTLGTTYVVSYYEAYRATNTNLLTAAISLSAGTATLGTSTGTGNVMSGNGTSTLTQTTGAPSAWTQYTFSFTPSVSATATLTFANAAGANNNGTFLDNASVVPEPATWALLTASLCAVLFLRRCRICRLIPMLFT